VSERKQGRGKTKPRQKRGGQQPDYKDLGKKRGALGGGACPKRGGKSEGKTLKGKVERGKGKMVGEKKKMRNKKKRSGFKET